MRRDDISHPSLAHHLLELSDDDGATTQADLRHLAELVKTWKRGVLVWNSKPNLDMLAQVEADLLEIADGLGANIQPDRLKTAGREKRREP